MSCSLRHEAQGLSWTTSYKHITFSKYFHTPMQKEQPKTLAGWWLNAVHHTDGLYGLKKMPDDCIDLAITSPPYWGQQVCVIAGSKSFFKDVLPPSEPLPPSPTGGTGGRGDGSS